MTSPPEDTGAQADACRGTAHRTGGAGDAEARWAAAARIAAGEEEDEAVVRPRRRVLLLVTVVLVVSALLVPAVGLLLWPPSPEAAGADVEGWRSVVQVALVGVGALVYVGGVVRARRQGAFSMRRSVMHPLRRPERQEARRQVLGRRRVDHERLPVLRAVAREQLRQASAVGPTLLAALLMGLGSVVGGVPTAVLQLHAVGLVVVVVGWSLAAVQVVRVRRFLDRHG